MKVRKVYCLFEQSGTFKEEFRKLGIDAEDYDILNDFGKTDHITDLFSEIEKAYEGKPSLFDKVGKRGSCGGILSLHQIRGKNPTWIPGETPQQKNWNDEQKLEYSMKLHEELHHLYMLVSKLFTIAIRGGWRMIVENPHMPPHYLTMYFPIKPKVIDKDRTENGDYYRKPTQYWFVNCEPEQNFIFEPLEWVPTHIIEQASKMECDYDRKVKRSLMHPQYARRFIKQYIIDQMEIKLGE